MSKLSIAIVPAAKAGCFDVLSGVGAARNFTSVQVEEMLMKLQPGDVVLYDVRREQRAA